MIDWIKRLFRRKPKYVEPQPLIPGIYSVEAHVMVSGGEWVKRQKTFKVEDNITWPRDLMSAFMTEIACEHKEDEGIFVDDQGLYKLDPTNILGSL